MAHCVASFTYDSDRRTLASACNVHAVWGVNPLTGHCHLNGQPASPVALHTWSKHSRDEFIEFWQQRTHRQRPMVVHQNQTDVEHNLSGQVPYPGCPCGAEILEPVNVDG